MTAPGLDRYGLRQRPQQGARLARCADVDCDAHVHGWRTTLHVGQGDLIKAIEASGRRFTRRLVGPHVEFTFPPGQQCFTKHPADTRQLFLVPSRRSRGLVETTPILWVEQFGENQQTLAELAARG